MFSEEVMLQSCGDDRYRIEDTSEIITPGVVVFLDVVKSNIDNMLSIAKGANRLRPHCKTHKMKEIVELQIAAGITKHKCATFAESEMVVAAGAKDVVLAYNMVGPNIARTVAFRQQYPDVKFAVTADHARPITQLSEQMAAAGQTVDVLLDLDTGQHRTGIAPGAEAAALYKQIVELPGINAAGFHVYDGQNHQTDYDERKEAVAAVWDSVQELRAAIEGNGQTVPNIVCGGTGSFPAYAAIDDPVVELSPGTCVFHDAGYGGMFPDLPFTPASLLLTRVISRPTSDRVTFDLGYKAVASDPPAGVRVTFPDLADANLVLQNEEHLVVETSQAEQFTPGDEILAVPRHACPTSALHRQVFVVSEGKLVDRWDVASRDRWLNI